MCWSGEASAVLAVGGVAATVYAYKKSLPTPMYVALGYFSLMEAFQAFTYLYINQCSSAPNQMLTLLSYLHISFHPFFINFLALHFIDQGVAKKIRIPVYGLCLMAPVAFVVNLYPFEWTTACKQGDTFCGPILCSVSGSWHLAWKIPLNSLEVSFGQIAPLSFSVGLATFAYFFGNLMLPIIYGSWRMALYQYVLWPLLSLLISRDANEFPAVWCLFSVGIFFLVTQPKVREKLYVKHWFLWPKKWISSSLAG